MCKRPENFDSTLVVLNDNSLTAPTDVKSRGQAFKDPFLKHKKTGRNCNFLKFIVSLNANALSTRYKYYMNALFRYTFIQINSA